MITESIYNQYIELLKNELVPALGCTEPIAIAYASAKARNVLGAFPEEIIVECSGNIIKNVKGVIVPTTHDMRGVEASAIIGAIGGNAEKSLEVLSEVTEQDVIKAKELVKTDLCKVVLKKGVSNLYIKVIMKNKGDVASVLIIDTHTNIFEISKNGETLFKGQYEQKTDKMFNKEIFNVDLIYEFAETVKIEDVEKLIDRQIDFNTKIANEGLKQSYGANVGKVLLHNSHDIKTLAKAYSAAGSDARMAGCTLPVIINSGSGNQGMTVSLPVIKYAECLCVPREKLIRALVLSNLLAIYQKSGIGKLSAYCGAVSAACGAGAAITYLYEQPLNVIKMTIKNVLGNVSGIVCDGAKSSCAAKIASSVDAAIMAHEMAVDGQVYSDGEGLNLDDVDLTIENVSHLAKEGMKETDLNILEMMINSRDYEQ
ncbi:MAG: L-serine ammonia-lyase, iron-sulfur-dependent, subunit alpha [Eubacteriales bacterium]